MLDDGRDVTSLLKALPPLTLPLELVALRDLGAAINLADHWPVVHVIAIPIEHARLAIDALPAFEGVFVNLGVAALVWLDATLPPTMPITLVLSPEELGTSSAFAYAWGDRITNVIVRGATVRKDPMPDMLGRCVNVQSVLIEANFVPVDKYVDALSTKQLHALQLDDMGQNTVDASGIVARLEEPRATTLLLTCNSVRDPAPLAPAIQDCSHLTSLRLGDALDVKAASVSLHHVTSLAILDNGFDDRLPVGPLRKLDRSKVVSFLLEHDVGEEGDEMPMTSVLDALAMCPALTTLSLTNLGLTADRRTTGLWPHLTTVRVRSMDFETPRELVAFIQWLDLALLEVCHLSGATLQQVAQQWRDAHV